MHELDVLASDPVSYLCVCVCVWLQRRMEQLLQENELLMDMSSALRCVYIYVSRQMRERCWKIGKAHHARNSVRAYACVCAVCVSRKQREDHAGSDNTASMTKGGAGILIV